MRLKSVDQFLLVLMFLTGSFSLFLLFSPENKQSNELAIGLIVDQINIVKKKGQIFEAWNDVSAGDSLRLNDQVYTHESSQVELQLRSGRKINVQENSLLKITADLLGEKVELERGTLKAILNSKNPTLNIKVSGKNVQLKSDNGTVQIEKTEDKSRIFVEGGSVQIEQAGSKQTIKENELFESDIKSGEIKVKSIAIKTNFPKDLTKIVLNDSEQVTFQWTWLKKNYDLSRRFTLQISEKKTFVDVEEHPIDRDSTSLSLNLTKEGNYFWRIKEEVINNVGQVIDSTTGPAKRFEVYYETSVIVENTKDIIPLLPDQKLNRINLSWVDSIASRLNENADYYMVKVTGLEGEKSYKTNLTQLKWAFTKIGVYQFQIKPFGKSRVKATWSKPYTINVVENAIPKIERITPEKMEYVDYSRKGMKALIRWKVLSGTGSFKIVLKNVGVTSLPERIYETDSDFINIDLLKADSYEWSVISRDTLGNSGQVIKGIIHLKFPRKVTTLPSEGEVVLLETPDQEVQFKWEKQTNVKSYLFELSKDKEFKTIEINTELEKSQFVTKLNDIGQYFWRVKMNTANGVEYSQPVSVEIKPVPVLDKPKLENEIRIKLKTIEETQTKDQVLRQNKRTKLLIGLMTYLFPSAMANKNEDKNKVSQVAEWTVPAAKNVKKYLVEIYRDKDLKELMTKIESDSEKISWKGASAGEFFWRLAYRDSWGRDSEYSLPAKIIIDQDELIASSKEQEPVVEEKIKPEINLITPKHRVVFEADKLSFSWELLNFDQKETKKIVFLIAKDLDFTETVLEKTLTKNELSLECKELQNLEANESYYWRIKVGNELSKRRAISFPCLNKFVLKKVDLQVAQKIDEQKSLTKEPMFKFFLAPTLTEQTAQYGSKKIIVDGQNLMAIGGWRSFPLENFWAKAVELELNLSSGKVFNTENYQKFSFASALKFPIQTSLFTLLTGINITQQSTYEIISNTPRELKKTMASLTGRILYHSDLFTSSLSLGIGNNIWFKPQVSKVFNNVEIGLFYQQTNFESEGSAGQKIETDESSLGLELSYIFY